MTITTRLMGGLGNQLFQYAAGRALARKHKTGLWLDDSCLGDGKDKTTKRDYELSPFAINIDGVKNCRPDSNATLLREERFLSRRPFLNAPPNSFLIGYWQGNFYLQDLQDELLTTIGAVEKMKKPFSKKSKETLAIIKKSNSVFLHIRRGDYASSPTTKDFHGLLPMGYYQRAIKILQQEIKQASFFIFSDDPAWVKQHLAIDNATTIYIDHNQGKDSWQDLLLMSHCQHGIIANSSFSFWAAYLLWLRHKQHGAIIIAPKQWFKKKLIDRRRWFPNDWRLLAAQSHSLSAPFFNILQKTKNILMFKS